MQLRLVTASPSHFIYNYSVNLVHFETEGDNFCCIQGTVRNHASLQPHSGGYKQIYGLCYLHSNTNRKKKSLFCKPLYVEVLNCGLSDGSDGKSHKCRFDPKCYSNWFMNLLSNFIISRLPVNETLWKLNCLEVWLWNLPFWNKLINSRSSKVIIDIYKNAARSIEPITSQVYCEN